MKLEKNWTAILRKAWSVRFIALAGLLSAAEVILPLYVDAMPRGTFAALSVLAVSGAFYARIVAQKDLEQ